MGRVSSLLQVSDDERHEGFGEVTTGKPSPCITTDRSWLPVDAWGMVGRGNPRGPASKRRADAMHYAVGVGVNELPKAVGGVVRPDEPTFDSR